MQVSSQSYFAMQGLYWSFKWVLALLTYWLY